MEKELKRETHGKPITFDRLSIITSELLEFLYRSGWTEDKIIEELNSVESNLTGGSPDKILTQNETIFLFGENP